MNSEDELIFNEYKSYCDHKEKFVDRNFSTNKFYLFLVLAIVLVMFLTKDSPMLYGMSSVFVLSIAGMAICVLWWINIDSYNLLIKIKLNKVLEEMEKRLPVKPYTDEYTAIIERRKNKREFLFSDMQKGLATLIFLFFFVIFINDFFSLFYAN